MASMTEQTLITEPSSGYELLDSGGGEKLERYGQIVVARPDVQALWPKSLPAQKWQEASARFEPSKTGGKWKVSGDIPESWTAELASLTFALKLSPFRHVGIFPEHAPEWQWLSEKVSAAIAPGRKVSVLNLFAYTGGASLACAKAGASVAHIDASQFAVDWAMKNRDVSGLSAAPIRFIVDDARKFVEREIKRGNTYDIILMDPPVYGKGAKEEVWKIEEDLLPLLRRSMTLLSADPLAVVLHGYASGYSHITYAQMLGSVLTGNIVSGEMTIRESASSRLLPAGIFARWEK
jgi:23S rRNA (cytosine1962-C5)-methyltransferase